MQEFFRKQGRHSKDNDSANFLSDLLFKYAPSQDGTVKSRVIFLKNLGIFATVEKRKFLQILLYIVL